MKIFDNGFIYKIFIDPLLYSLHNELIKFINSSQNVIDIACGTGSLAYKLGKKAKYVVGIDISYSMIKEANKRKIRYSKNNVKFMIKNASDISSFKNKEFDIGIISMAIHQFPIDISKKILINAKRISKKIIVLDYAYPLPDNIYKKIVYILEKMAGHEHYINFKKYLGYGGILKILNDCNLIPDYIEKIKKDIFIIINY